MTMRRDVHDELRARLHEAAGEHEPDRERVLARVERVMARPARPGRRATRPPVLGWVRVAGTTASVAGVLAVGGFAVASVVTDEEPPSQRQMAVSPTPEPAPSPDATSRAPLPPAEPSTDTSKETGGPGSPPARTPGAGTPTTKAPGAVRQPEDVEDGPLWSDGSVDRHSNEFWAQSNITLKIAERLTALTVELRIAQTGGVSSTGAWRSLPEKDFSLTTDERDGFVVYTWTLRKDRTVAPGEWVFAGQYDHARGGRDAKADTYTATAAAGSEQLLVGGGFAARDD
ncbi:hypothetical protein [Streptomyces sp. KMM 9044]|uniref:hypothetical protein n=1 Tax=Streptomyces sp. KMM 9044 TaxID=2744474 RepID=UPI002151725F|nr:hypothetical protein [Streptomyces sp. KMM 9044]WAX80685.1 hypothetical protein HUV60_026490 [Streptomyces sp. KMM 9044]